MVTRLKDLIQGKISINDKTRSSEWPKVRNRHLQEHPKCEVCEGVKSLNVHHIKPYHLHPELELEPTNLITLCESGSLGLNCHLLIGHLGNFKDVNPSSVEDSKIWHDKLQKRDEMKN